MTEDARFEDAGGRPLYLGAMDPDDLAVLSALVQDAVLPSSEMVWKRSERRLAFLLNRLRREDEVARGGVERVQSVLVLDNVLGVASQGITKGDPDVVLQVLSLTFSPATDGAGHVEITFAGDGALRAEVEALEVTLRDVTKPYLAPSRKTPDHSG